MITNLILLNIGIISKVYIFINIDICFYSYIILCISLKPFLTAFIRIDVSQLISTVRECTVFRILHPVPGNIIAGIPLHFQTSVF